MSSGFVPAGQSGAPPEATDAWEKAKAEIEENRQRRTAAEPGLQEGGKSLYEHLQANKGDCDPILLIYRLSVTLARQSHLLHLMTLADHLVNSCP